MCIQGNDLSVPATLASLRITVPSFTTNHRGVTSSLLCRGHAFPCLKAFTQAQCCYENFCPHPVFTDGWTFPVALAPPSTPVQWLQCKLYSFTVCFLNCMRFSRIVKITLCMMYFHMKVWVNIFLHFGECLNFIHCWILSI